VADDRIDDVKNEQLDQARVHQEGTFLLLTYLTQHQQGVRLPRY
jgi:hypothetical protein